MTIYLRLLFTFNMSKIAALMHNLTVYNSQFTLQEVNTLILVLKMCD